jgi:hypothetical protein
METGGIAGSTSSPSKSIIDYDLLANKIASANMSLPAPRVGVDEIASVANRISVIESQASF